MRIAICGSMQFAKEMIKLKAQLESIGHSIVLPKDTDLYANGSKSVETKWEKVEGDLIRGYYEKIKDADAVLIANYSKNGIENYVGGNALLEMGFAHVLNKKIYLLHSVPVMNYSDEIESMKPMVLSGDVLNMCNQENFLIP